MKLNKKSWHTWYYRQFYGGANLPPNLCPYFWALLAALLLFPITYSSTIYNLFFYRKKVIYAEPWFKGVLFYFWTFIFGLVIDLVLHGDRIPSKFDVFVFDPSLGTVATLILIALFIISIKLFRLYRNHFPKKTKVVVTETKVYKEPKPNIIIEMIKAIYGKYCPKIDWYEKS